MGNYELEKIGYGSEAEARKEIEYIRKSFNRSLLDDIRINFSFKIYYIVGFILYSISIKFKNESAINIS